MKLFYNSSKIYYAIPDSELFWFTHTCNVPLTELEIDELDPDNKAICIDLKKFVGTNRTDANRNPKYYIEDGELHAVENWVEQLPEINVGEIQ